ncbi:hypothetical protein PK28_12485 [Hymenobacter sp. DG25B]|uniref:hypothetical protein n=1 Tax=Hymenobacter sp. DG25B TaxID=1385664 RepID=UPI0005406EE0|nr:hypothetical protein [Hymenobacter sp. DG25B]AIZ64296.1 hypothetical protein PK28_12485 [Hymenobacter sp. DG25B]
MPITYRPLFFLENDSISLVEIKRTDLPGEQNPDQVYHWLRFDKKTQQLQKQAFVSMNSQPTLQERTFQQGQLQFTTETGTYTDQETGQRQELRVQNPAELPEDLTRAIAAYLQAL